MFDAIQIANWYVRRALRDGRNLSIMSVLKLIYIAHGWHLEIFKQPLFHNRIEAWKFGPVVPDAYRCFRGQGVLIERPVTCEETTLSDETERLLEEVYGIYGSMSAFKLSDITHVENGPWDIASKQNGYFAEISDEAIQSHYELLRRNAKSTEPV